MLLDRYRQLLTAYVDGETTNRQRRHVARLLRRSPEARQLLQQLQQDADALRQLPCAALPEDLAGPVLRTIAERRLSPGQRRLTTPSPAAWSGPFAAWAIAATVLFVLGVASYLYFAAALSPSGDTAQVETPKEQPAHSPKQPKAPSPPSLARREPSAPAPTVKTPVPPDRPPTVEQPAAIVERPKDEPKKPSLDPRPTPPKEEPVLTDRLEMFQLTKVSDYLPEVFALRELEGDATRKKLIAALGKDREFRLELPCQNGTRAFQRVQSAARASNIGLSIEKIASERLKLQSNTNYLVYVENMTPEEVARFLQRIGSEDARHAAKKPAEAQFDRLVLTRLTSQNHKELSALLGADSTAKEPSPKGPLGADPRKPLSEETARQVSQSLAGKGGGARSRAGKSSAKAPAHLALVLAYNSVRPSPNSDEIKHFLESRKPAKPGTLRILLLLRG